MTEAIPQWPTKTSTTQPRRTPLPTHHRSGRRRIRRRAEPTRHRPRRTLRSGTRSFTSSLGRTFRIRRAAAASSTSYCRRKWTPTLTGWCGPRTSTPSSSAASSTSTRMRACGLPERSCRIEILAIRYFVKFFSFLKTFNHHALFSPWIKELARNIYAVSSPTRTVSAP